MKIKLGSSSDDLFLERDNKIIPTYDAANSLTKGHDYVEIGGIKWATMNVGATGVTDGGLYFAWGETDGYLPSQVGTDKNFDWADHKFSINGDPSNLKKYKTTDAYRTLVPCDDPVTVNWGGAWRSPTREEFAALSGAVTTEWVTDYQGSGVNGLVLTDKNDSTKQLFFPAAGYGVNGGTHGDGESGNYWSSSVSEEHYSDGSVFGFNSDEVTWGEDNFRRYGYSVRGVF